MKPYDCHKGTRRKRIHSVKCLRCLKVFLSKDLKTNRVCYNCQQDFWWKQGPDSPVVG